MLAFGHGRHGVNVKTQGCYNILGGHRRFKLLWIPFFSFRRWPIWYVNVSVSLWEKSCISVGKEVKTNTIYFVGMFLKNIDLNGWRLTEVSDGWSGISLFFCGTAFHVEFRQAEEKAAAEGLNSQLPGKDWVLQHGAHLYSCSCEVVLST